MNILFLLRTCEVGGIGVVTSTLANKFVNEGHHVILCSFLQPPSEMLDKFDRKVKVVVLGRYANSHAIVEKLRTTLIGNKIDIIINQLGLPFLPILIANKASKGLNIKIISVYHNQIDTNGKVMAVEQALLSTKSLLKKNILVLKKCAIKFITSRSMRYVYNHSDVYEVLSPSFVELFKKFTGIKNPTKLVVQTNPITIDNEENQSSASIDLSQKQKEIIYVGRLDFVQKRVYRVIDTWNYLEENFPDWKLTIVGDGDDRENLENHVKALGLKRVVFEGFQKPVPYYKRASILLLTSDFEGFPLVLAECMSFGVIPAVYNSYSAVGDIIDNGKDGIVIPYHKDGYQAEEAASLLVDIMENESKREQMAIAAIEKSKKYSVEKIYGEWEKVFKALSC